MAIYHQDTPATAPQCYSTTDFMFDTATIRKPSGRPKYGEEDFVYPHEIVMSTRHISSGSRMNTTMGTAFTTWRSETDKKDNKGKSYVYPVGVSLTRFVPENYNYTQGFAVYLSGSVPLLNNYAAEGHVGTKPGQLVCAISPAIVHNHGIPYDAVGHQGYVAFPYWDYELDEHRGTLFEAVRRYFNERGWGQDHDDIKKYVKRLTFAEIKEGASVGGYSQIVFK